MYLKVLPGRLVFGPVLAALLIASTGTVAQESGFVTAPTPAPDLLLHATPALSGVVMLHPRLLVQLVVKRSAEIEYGRLQLEVAKHLYEAEAALYEPVLYSSLRHEDRERQRGVEERLSSFATSGIAVLDEQVRTAEAGVRNRLPTGAEVSLSYRLRNKRNNIISQNRSDYEEYEGALVLTVKQPLLRGAGRSVVETDYKVAEAERKISGQQYKQQLLKTSSEALALYWQLYRALEINRIRELALENGLRTKADTENRIESGKVPKSALLEIEAAILVREVELMRSAQGVREAQTRLATMLNLSALTDADIRLVVNPDQVEVKPMAVAPLELYRRALPQWPALRIAHLRAEQAHLRLDFASNARKPALDLVFSRSNNGLAESNKFARSITESGHYPEWYVGLNFEMPIGGNGKARSQYLAQAQRVKQAQVEIESIEQALANDILVRAEQLAVARNELQRLDQDLALRKELLRIERVRFGSGMGSMRQLLDREAELAESRQRLVEGMARLGQANDALLLADGSMLDKYGVTIKDIHE